MTTAAAAAAAAATPSRALVERRRRLRRVVLAEVAGLLALLRRNRKWASAENPLVRMIHVFVPGWNGPGHFDLLCVAWVWTSCLGEGRGPRRISPHLSQPTPPTTTCQHQVANLQKLRDATRAWDHNDGPAAASSASSAEGASASGAALLLLAPPPLDPLDALMPFLEVRFPRPSL